MRRIEKEALMDFIEEIRNLSAKITKQKEAIRTEEATKTACVMPFINLLGNAEQN